MAGTLHDALAGSARELENRAPLSAHDHRTTLAIMAGCFFLLGFLWAKARAQSA